MAWCSPELEIDKEFYHAGEEVTGRAWVSTKKDMHARNATITFVGRTVTAWKSDEKESEIKSAGFAKAEDIHVKFSHEVWKPENEENVFPAGDYEWKFSFELPKECPPSFEGKYGFIRYTVKINLDVPNWPDTHVTKAISVSPTIDLNLIPGARDVAAVQLENPVKSCWPCIPNVGPFKKGNVSFTMSAPTLGYVSGQTLSLTCLVENHTQRIIESVVGSLNRMAIFRENAPETFFRRSNKPAPRDDSSNSNTLITTLVSKPPVNCNLAPGAAKEFTFTFDIPPVVATIRSAQYISVEYFVRVNAEMEGYSCSEAKADMNIIVGNVPLLNPGSTEVPPYILRKGDGAWRWADSLSVKFVPLLPYFGDEEEEPKEAKE